MRKITRRRFLQEAGGGCIAAGLGISSSKGSLLFANQENLATRLNYKIGMGQMLVTGGEVEENLSRATAVIKKAAAKGCKIVVLPECLDCGWTHPKSSQLSAPIPGAYSDRLVGAAQANHIYVVAGLTEKSGEHTYNSAVLISDHGEILLKHRKINVLTIAQDIYSIGDRLGVIQTPLGTIGINICADNFSDTLVFAHSLARMGAQIILSPSAWAVDADHDNGNNPYGGGWRRSYEKLAQLYDITVIGVSNVGWINAGVWKGRKCIGCSMAVGPPDGRMLAECPYGAEAEHLEVVEVKLLPREVTGTAISEMLKKKTASLTKK
jgi:predicted amidohydrolase